MQRMLGPRLLKAAVPLLALSLAMILSACGGDPGISPSPTDSGDPAPESEPTTVAAGPSGSTQLPATTRPQPTSASSQDSSSVSARAATETPEVEIEASESDAAEGFPTPPERDFYRLAKELIPGVEYVDPIVRHNSPTLEVGHRKTFKLVDLDSRRLYESDFELLHVSPNAYWFFEDGVQVQQDDIEISAQEFEDNIYPRVTSVFGQEWTPGVDGDTHLYIISAHLRGVGGYFSAADEYPREIRPVSNEIEAVYVNARYLPVGSSIFSHVLAHELQHAIHWLHDRSEETWVNEGLSELP